MEWSRRSRLLLGGVAVATLWGVVFLGVAHRTQTATQVLAEATTFRGGDPDLQWLLHIPGAEERASRLTHSAYPAAKLYGLCGLYLLGSKQRVGAARDLQRDDAEVRTVFGCLGSSSKVKDLAADLPNLCASFRTDVSYTMAYEVRRLTGR
jgi:hypothetical protein